MYSLVVCKLKVAHSEYMKMTAHEVLLHIEEAMPKHVGGFHVDELEQLEAVRERMEAAGIEVA